MLLGRQAERQDLDRILADARLGRSGVLAISGEPGIGKTALLEYASARAEGMRVLRARGIESEAQVPFAGLLELLRPALGSLDRIPQPQASALSAALALGRFVADPIAAILATRDTEPSVLSGAQLPQLRLEGLDHAAAAALLAEE